MGDDLENLWELSVKAKPESGFTVFSMGIFLNPCQLILHPKFGKGKVQDIAPYGNARVLFKDGLKTLALTSEGWTTKGCCWRTKETGEVVGDDRWKQSREARREGNSLSARFNRLKDEIFTHDTKDIHKSGVINYKPYIQGYLLLRDISHEMFHSPNDESLLEMAREVLIRVEELYQEWVKLHPNGYKGEQPVRPKVPVSTTENPTWTSVSKPGGDDDGTHER